MQSPWLGLNMKGALSYAAGEGQSCIEDFRLSVTRTDRIEKEREEGREGGKEGRALMYFTSYGSSGTVSSYTFKTYSSVLMTGEKETILSWSLNAVFLN